MSNLIEMDIIQTIFKRRSIRKYREQVVSDQILVSLLKAGMAAPTACNNQPWEFIIVTDPISMVKLRNSLEHGKYNAPAAIIVCHNAKIGKNPKCDPFWIQDCSAAVENIIIAATGLGLGTVWLGVYPKEDAIESVSQSMGIPSNVTPLAVIYIGYPAEHKPARTQYDESRVHWQNYSG